MAPPLPSVRRGFVDTRDGQIHYRAAGLAQSSRLPLICFHQSPISSLYYEEILPYLGAERPAIAMDTPGFGESFRPKAKPTLPDYAGWLYKAIAALGYRRFDVMGTFTGAGIAADMAMRWPDAVRRLVMIGPPYFTEAKPNVAPWPTPPVPDGSHMMVEWKKMMLDPAKAEVPFDRRWELFRELWRGGADAIWGEEAVSAYNLKDTLPHVRQPTLAIQPDSLRADVAAAVKALPNAKLVRLEGVKPYTILQLIPERLATIVNGFLDSAGD